MVDTSTVITTGIAGGLPLLAGIVWAVRLEGRLNAHEAVDDERAATVDKRYLELQSWLIRVESKLDHALSGR